MPGKFREGSYRYAYQGQEKDGETGFEAFELRQWDGRIGRWMTTDPYGQYVSTYLGMGNNPINQIDTDGGWTTPPDHWRLGSDGKLRLIVKTNDKFNIFFDTNNKEIFRTNQQISWNSALEAKYKVDMSSIVLMQIGKDQQVFNTMVSRARKVGWLMDDKLNLANVNQMKSNGIGLRSKAGVIGITNLIMDFAQGKALSPLSTSTFYDGKREIGFLNSMSLFFTGKSIGMNFSSEPIALPAESIYDMSKARIDNTRVSN